jgi:hypothetical protein
MANEIRVAFNDGYTIYVIIRNDSGQIWDVGDGAFEAVGTWNDARVGECDIALTAKDGELYLGTFPAAINNGTYTVEAYIQGGGSPDTDDDYIGAEEFSWTGSSKILIAMHHYMAL